VYFPATTYTDVNTYDSLFAVRLQITLREMPITGKEASAWLAFLMKTEVYERGFHDFC
jgi:hypothetical protein